MDKDKKDRVLGHRIADDLVIPQEAWAAAQIVGNKWNMTPEDAVWEALKYMADGLKSGKITLDEVFEKRRPVFEK